VHVAKAVLYLLMTGSAPCTGLFSFMSHGFAEAAIMVGVFFLCQKLFTGNMRMVGEYHGTMPSLLIKGQKAEFLIFLTLCFISYCLIDRLSLSSSLPTVREDPCVKLANQLASFSHAPLSLICLLSSVCSHLFALMHAAFAWVGHFAFEKNVPATFIYV
jgi:hypothetical protein